MSGEQFKNEGNAYFQKGKYKEAVESYSKAIEVENEGIYYLNRSQARLQLKQYQEALEDVYFYLHNRSEKNIHLSSKGFYRAATIFEQIDKKLVQNYLIRALQCEKANSQVIKQLADHRKQNFEKNLEIVKKLEKLTLDNFYATYRVFVPYSNLPYDKKIKIFQEINETAEKNNLFFQFPKFKFKKNENPEKSEEASILFLSAGNSITRIFNSISELFKIYQSQNNRIREENSSESQDNLQKLQIFINDESPELLARLIILILAILMKKFNLFFKLYFNCVWDSLTFLEFNSILKDVIHSIQSQSTLPPSEIFIKLLPSFNLFIIKQFAHHILNLFTHWSSFSVPPSFLLSSRLSSFPVRFFPFFPSFFF